MDQPTHAKRVCREQTLFGDGSVLIVQHERESQGEHNVQPVVDAISISFGIECEPREHTAETEDGADAYLIETDGLRRPVQIVRALDQQFCADVAAKGEATQRLAIQNLLSRIGHAIDMKTCKMPDADRQQTLLAFDVRANAWLVWLALGEPTQWEALQSKVTAAGWWDVVVVGKTVVVGPKGKDRQAGNCISLRGTMKKPA